MKTIEITRTKGNNLPAMWEEGGGRTNTGAATIIARPDGRAMKPVFIPRGGPLACGQHALFVIRPGCFVVKAEHRRGRFEISVLKILRTEGLSNPFAVVEEVALMEGGRWVLQPDDFELQEALLPAIQMAITKAQEYHCRRAYFVAG